MDEERVVAQEDSQPQALDSEPAKKKKEKDMSAAGVSRRAFVGGGVAAGCLLVLGGARYAVSGEAVIRPPGGQDEDYHVAACIRCMRCYEACPRSVIVPSHFENGLVEFRTPTLDFEEDYCDFCQEENGGVPLCVKNCPTHALKLDEGATAETTVIGVATIDTYQCLAYRDTGCKKCSEVCPYEAIDLIGGGDNGEMPRPRVNTDNCTGCGACEAYCPSLKNASIAAGATERAITVKPLGTIEE